MSSYVNDYTDLLKIARDEFEDLLENATISNFFELISKKNYYNYLGRYYYNKTLSDEYDNRIIVAPKKGYITNRLVYLNDNLTGGTKVGVQAINITEQDGNIRLRNNGAVGYCPLARFFDSLCYAFGIEVDKTKINIYDLCDSVLQNYEFVYNRENGTHISINSATYDLVHILYIVEDEKTYFDEDLVQDFANAMYEAGWFSSGYLEGNVYTNIPQKGQYPTHLRNMTINDIDGFINACYTYLDEDYKEIALQAKNLCLTALSFMKSKYPDFKEICINLTNPSLELNKYQTVEIIATTQDFQNVDKYFNIYATTPFNSYKTSYRYYAKVMCSYAGSVVSSANTMVSGDLTYSWVDNIGGTGTYSGLVSGFWYTDAPQSHASLGIVNSSGIYKEEVYGITVIDNAKLPTGTNSLNTDYPNWFSNLKNIVGTAVDDAGETLRNVFNIIEFVPLTLIGGEKPTQESVQTGVVLSPVYIGTLPEYTVKYLTPLPSIDTPISPDVPYVPIDDYTPSTPDSVYPWNPNPDTPIGNPIVDPINPPAIGGITPTIPDNPIINSSNGLFTVYNPTQEQLNQFGGYLWGEDVVGILQSIFQNPMQAIISLHVLYATPATGDERPIRLGYMTSNVNAKEVTEQYIDIDCGTVNVPEYYGNVLDYSPYTKAHIYLPFIGIREINVNEIMGSQVNVNYKVDVLTGSVYASISVFHNAISQVLYTFEGNCAVQLPMTGGDVTRLLSGMITGMAVGAKGGLTGAVIGTATGAFASGGLSVSKTNSIGANAGAMGIKKPYIIITHSQAYMANNYNTQYGYPSNLTTQLSACKGYTRVKEVHVDNILVATQEEKDMIQTLLREGVIIE